MSDRDRKSDGPLNVVLEVPDHESLLDLMTILDESDLAVRTETIVRASPQDGAVADDLDVLTEKQRQAMELALREGYYERPRDATLTDLAEQLDLSKSAVSQRLNMGEVKLVKAAFGAVSDGA